MLLPHERGGQASASVALPAITEEVEQPDGTFVEITHEPRRRTDLDIPRPKRSEDDPGGPNTPREGIPHEADLHPRSSLPTKTRPEDQPLPTVSDRPFVQRLVIADIEDRIKIGVERYGTPLQTFNGRNADLDAYEEAMDLTIYLKQRLIERGAMREAIGEIVAHLQTDAGSLDAPSNVVTAIEVLQKGLDG